jgi:hypothetical protein
MNPSSVRGGFVEVDLAHAHIVSVRGSTEPQSGSRLLHPIARAIAARSSVPVAYTELRTRPRRPAADG